MITNAQIIAYLSQYPRSYYVVMEPDEVVPGLESETICLRLMVEQFSEEKVGGQVDGEVEDYNMEEA
jgi:hypothetical protein